MEEHLLICGGKKLDGLIKVDASKNAFLPILAATILCDGEIFLKNYVDLSDINCMQEILKQLCINSFVEDGGLYINTLNIKNNKISHEFTQKIRASIFILGALLSRFGSAVVAYPGGCKIGSRPIDLHIKGLKSLGVDVVEKHGYIYCDGKNMHSGVVFLDFPSVGATESLMMCATCIKGRTILKNVAKEPEIVDLQNFLVAMGAKISGAGGDVIVIDGVDKLHGGEFTVMPDRIVAGTYLIATACCGGDVTIENFIPEHNESLLSVLSQSACNINIKNDTIRMVVHKRLNCADCIQTFPFPYFPTDLQSQMIVLQSVSHGCCVVVENVFENRFGIVPELNKMGAKIVVKGRNAYIQGVEGLFGAPVFATDLRSGAGLVIAGLKADGYTTVHNIEYIDRGYEKIEEKLRTLGADIKRIK